MEMEETKIGRLVHKIEKLKTLGERTPGVEFMRSEVFSGDHGLAVIEHAPFGVIGAITPVTHSLPTITGNAVSMIAGGNTLVVNPHPERQARGGRRRAALQRGDLPRPGHRQPDLRHRRADARIGQRDLQPSRHQADLRHRRPGRGPRGHDSRASGPSSPGRAIRRSWSTKRPISIAPPAAIIQGGAYDNNLLCIAEKEVFVVGRGVRRDAGRHGAGRRRAAQRPRDRRADQGGDHHGRRRGAQARRAGQGFHRPGRRRAGRAASASSVPAETELLFGETDESQPVRARRADDALRAVRPRAATSTRRSPRPSTTSTASATRASSTRTTCGT